MHIPTLISHKRDGGELDPHEISALVRCFTDGSLPDYQMSALAMAIFFRGMTPSETAALTRAMMDSGDRFSHPSGPPVVDKHSTGGIGDKVSLILAPILACAGCRVPMVSGRGLGITGGTLDKLESIPGLRVHLTLDEAADQLRRIGVVMMGQTDRFCPADRKLYALRDVTGTVPSIPLITASIMSKKLAESLDRLVLDVKFGTGAFMRTKTQATELADAMTAVGHEMGVEIHTRLHPMNEPTGHAVGNALEVIEALQCLEGAGPRDLRIITLDLAEPIAGLSRPELENLLDNGAAREKFDEMVTAQGGSPTDLTRLAAIHQAPIVREVPSPSTGSLEKMDAGWIGQAALQLGAGRSRADDSVDFAVGFDQIAKTGQTIHAGHPLCRIHARTQTDFDMAEALFLKAVHIRSHS